MLAGSMLQLPVLRLLPTDNNRRARRIEATHTWHQRAFVLCTAPTAIAASTNFASVRHLLPSSL